MPSSRPISPMSASEARNRNDEPRAVTKSQRRRARSMMSSSGSASATAAYGPASPRRRNGSTAIDGFADSVRAASGSGGGGRVRHDRAPGLDRLHGNHEAETLPVHGADVALGRAVVAERLPRRLDAA